MRRRLFVTGGSGLLGANVALGLSGSYDVTAAYHAAAIESELVGAVALDLRSEGAVETIVASHPDLIIHCAAATDVERCERDQSWAADVNIEGTRRVAKAAAASEARLIVISTDSVFSGDRPGWRESDVPRPLNAYARTKLEAERVALSIAPDCLVVRTVIYGWNAQPKASLAEWALRRLEAGERVPGFVDAFFTPILVNDLGDALARLLALDVHGVLHVAGTERISKFAFAQAIAKVFALEPALVEPASIDDAGFGAVRPRDTSLDCSLALAQGLRLPTVNEGLARFATLRDTGFADRLRALTKGG